MDKELREKWPAPVGGEARQLNERRPPVIVILGHVDHGKTTLLDYVRKSNVAGREAGGITQSIGAYEITHAPRESAPAEGRKMTFIDTPGHEAFSRMRSRGAQVADLAILVVAADDGVQPQTKEAIRIIQEAKIPYVVAINKIDKEGVDINKTKNELTAEGVLLEGYGGNISYQPISAKTGKGVSELLDLLLLASDLEDLSFNSENPSTGVILESKLDSRRGIVAVGIVKDGTLKVGEAISAGTAGGKVKGLENFLGKRITHALPSSPVRISGFQELPEIGEDFFVGTPREKSIEIKTKNNISQFADIPEGKLAVNVILKADVFGSLEALSHLIKDIPKPEKIVLRIIDESVGDISDGDVQGAISSKASIIGFRAKPTKAAENLAEAQRIKIITSEIIYELVKALEEDFKNIDKTIVKGDLEILAVFGKKGTAQIVGGRVLSGEILNNANLEIVRRDAVLGNGKILNLQKGKKDIQIVEAGSETGILIESDVMIKEGDHLVMR